MSSNAARKPSLNLTARFASRLGVRGLPDAIDQCRRADSDSNYSHKLHRLQLRQYPIRCFSFFLVSFFLSSSYHLLCISPFLSSWTSSRLAPRQAYLHVCDLAVPASSRSPGLFRWPCSCSECASPTTGFRPCSFVSACVAYCRNHQDARVGTTPRARTPHPRGQLRSEFLISALFRGFGYTMRF